MSRRKREQSSGCARVLVAPIELLVRGGGAAFSYLSQRDIPLPGQRRISYLSCLIFVAGLVMGFAYAISRVDTGLRQVGLLPSYTSAPSLTPTITSTPTVAPTLTATPRDTPPPPPTGTPEPTDTPVLNATPVPTSTAILTATSTAVLMGAATTGVNLRSGPGTNYAKIGSLATDDQCQILHRTSDSEWYRVKARSVDIAWVAAAYISTAFDRAAVPTIAPDSVPPARTAIPTRSYQTARVTHVVDGDTIEVESGDRTHRVRYIGIDTPEQGEPFFAEATEANRQLVEGQTVGLEKDVSDTDGDGRLLRYVYLEDGTFVNAELVRLGYAQVATFAPDVKYQDVFLRLQAQARIAGRGLWAQPERTPRGGAVGPICDCSSNIYNCSDLTTQVAAQACHDYCRSLGKGDVHRLDGDNHGIACESLP